MTARTAPAVAADRPMMSFWQIWNMCFGFLGIQFAFALQNGNVSYIFQTLGAANNGPPKPLPFLSSPPSAGVSVDVLCVVP